MAVFFTRRGAPPSKPAIVTITGTGDASYCYVTFNGTAYTAAASDIEVWPGDVITFGVHGSATNYYGEVTIDGTQALKVTDKTTKTYEWTVPEGTKTISISLSYTTTSSQRYGRITVTTS